MDTSIISDIFPFESLPFELQYYIATIDHNTWYRIVTNVPSFAFNILSKEEQNAIKKKFATKVIENRNAEIHEYYVLPDGTKHGPYLGRYTHNNLTSECRYEDNKLNGEYIRYRITSDNHNIMYRCYYIDGKKEGRAEGRFPHGQISIIEYFKNDILDGERILYFAYGGIKSKHRYSDGKFDGECEDRYPSGIPSIKVCYSHNKPHGLCIKYDINGQISTQKRYNNGVEVVSWIKNFHNNIKSTVDMIKDMFKPDVD